MPESIGKQQFWSADEMRMVESNREYEEYPLGSSVVTGEWNGLPMYSTRVLYVDVETGICVRDIAAFEKWIEARDV